MAHYGISKPLVGIPSFSQAEYEASLNPTDEQEIELSARVYELARQISKRVPRKTMEPEPVEIPVYAHRGNRGHQAGFSLT